MSLLDFLAPVVGNGYTMPGQRPPLSGTGDFLGALQPEGGDPNSGAGGMGLSPARQTAAPPPKKHGGVRDFLGNLGDALLVGAGGEAIYGPKKQREQIGSQLSAYLGVDDPNLLAIMQEDPGEGFKLWQSRQPKPSEPFTLGQGQVRYGADGREIARGPADGGDDPTFIRELQALGIDPASDLAKQIFYAKNSPAGFMFKPSGGGGSPRPQGELPKVSTPDEAHRLPPGSKFMLPDGRIGTVPGGGAGNGTGGFPGR